MGKKITIILFFATILGISVITFLSDDREFSEMENRVLATKPEFSYEKLIAGDFADDLEKYLSDQLFMKDSFVMLKNNSDLLSGKDRLGSVYYSDGRYIREFVENEQQINSSINYINNWISANQISKDKVSFVLIPTASYVYGDQLPDSSTSDSEENTFKIIEDNFNGTFVSMKDIFKDAKDENIYFRTDHHWTMYGAYLGYEHLMQQLGKEAVKLSDFTRIDLDNGFFGSLYSQAPLFNVDADNVTFYDYENLNYTVTYELTGEERDSFLIEDNFISKDKYTALFGGNYGRLTITNHDNPDGEKLIVFKDSYSNSIIPYLISHYSVIEVIDLRYSVMRPGYYSDKTDYNVMFIYNSDFMNTDNNFIKLNYF